MRGPLVCDLDGTIADTAAAIFESLHVTCAGFGVALDRDADLSWCLGPPLYHCLRRLGVPETSMTDAIAIFETAHTERLGLVVPMPGAVETITRLRADGIEIGVATIKPQPIAELVLETVGLRGQMRAVVGRRDDLDPRTKTDLVREALHLLSGPAPVYVGDHDGDAEAAEVLGLPFVRYPEESWDDVAAAVYGVRPMNPAS